MALIASTQPLALEVGDDVPEWIARSWISDSARLAGPLEEMIQAGSIAPHLKAGYDAADEPVRRIAAYTEGAQVTVQLSGRGWQVPSASARRELQQNLAHELIHTHQLQLYDSVLEPRWVHEGFAEALSIELLLRAEVWTDREVSAYRRRLDEECAAVLEEGPLAAAFARGERRASYACGFVVIDAMAQSGGLPVSELFSVYANAQGLGLNAVFAARRKLPPGYLARVSRFIFNDHRGAPGQRIVAALRSGRL